MIEVKLKESLTSNLLAQWKLNDYAASATIEENVASVDGAFVDDTGSANTNYHSVAGKINRAMVFNGQDNGIKVPNTGNKFDLTTAFSISLWFYANSWTINDDEIDLIGKYVTAGRYTFAILYDNNELIFRVSNGANIDAESTTNPSLDEWHHVVAVFDTSTIKIYLDGELEDTENFIGTVEYNSSRKVYIGCRGYSDDIQSEFFKGIIDNVMIFNTNLDADDVTELYNNGKGNEDDLIWESKITDALNIDDLLTKEANTCNFELVDSYTNRPNEGEEIKVIDRTNNQLEDIIAGCICNWKLNDNADNTDVKDSISGRSGILAGGDNTSDISEYGKIKRALRFDGTNDYVDCGSYNETDMGLHDFTLCAWIKRDNNSRNELIVSREGVDPRYYFAIYGNVLQFVSIQNGGSVNVRGTATLDADTWYFVCVVCDRESQYPTFYVNAISDTLSFNTGSLITLGNIDNTNNFKIGGGTSANEFDGAIDNVMVFKHALSSDQITALYNYTKGIEVDFYYEKIFHGRIVSIESEKLNNSNFLFHVDCTDWQVDLDKKLAVQTYEDQTLYYIINDLITRYASGFTVANVENPGPTIDRVQFNYQYMTECFQEIAEIIGYDWYVDYDKDIHFFPVEENEAPHVINDDNEDFDNLAIIPDNTQLANRIWIRGGYYKSDLYTQDTITAVAGQTEFEIAYYPHEFEVWVDSVQKTVGIQFIDSPGSHDFLLNYNEKLLITDTITMSGSEAVVMKYKYEIPILAMVEDQPSQLAIAAIEGGDGIYEKYITDEKIQTIDQARERGKAEILKYGNPLVNGSFMTFSRGWRTGQRIHIDLTDRNIDEYYLIRNVKIISHGGGTLQYQVVFSTFLQGFTWLIIQILDKLQPSAEREDEILDQLSVINTDNFTFNDSAPTYEQYTPPFQYGPGGSPQGVYNESQYS